MNKKLDNYAMSIAESYYCSWICVGRALFQPKDEITKAYLARKLKLLEQWEARVVGEMDRMEQALDRRWSLAEKRIEYEEKERGWEQQQFGRITFSEGIRLQRYMYDGAFGEDDDGSDDDGGYLSDDSVDDDYD